MENTTYADLKKWFLNKITAYGLCYLEEEDRENLLNSYITIACSRFRCCKQDLQDRDDTNATFNIVLDNEVLDILSEIMVNIWLYPKLMNEELMHNSLSTDDYTMFSPGNLLSKIKETYELSEKRCGTMMGNYSFNYGKLPQKEV